MTAPSSRRNRPVVWKFELRPWSIFHDVPQGATFLSAAAQGPGERVVAWALCDPNAPKVGRILCAVPTGSGLPPALGDDPVFVGTARIRDDLIFHVFDGGESDGRE